MPDDVSATADRSPLPFMRRNVIDPRKHDFAETFEKGHVKPLAIDEDKRIRIELLDEFAKFINGADEPGQIPEGFKEPDGARWG